MKYKVSLAAILLFVSSSLLADAFERGRDIQRSFPVKENTEIQIINKYGNIEIVNWDKDSVMFQINITVKGNRLTRVNKTFDYIDIDFTANPYYIIAQTNIKNEQNNFWTDINDITNSIFKGNNNTSIDYKVYLPSNLSLKIKNKFGNIYLTNCDARTEIELSNGDLRANESNDFLHLKLSYGYANIKKITQAFIQLSYGELRADNTEDLELNSRSSTIRCDFIKELTITSKHDKIYLGEIENIDGGFSFSEMNIDNLSDRVKLDTNFGEITIDNVNKDFRNVYLNSNSTDISLSFHRSAIYNIDLSFTRRTEVSLPSNCKIVEQEESEKNNDDTHLLATCGLTSEKSPKVKILQDSGSIRLSNK